MNKLPIVLATTALAATVASIALLATRRGEDSTAQKGPGHAATELVAAQNPQRRPSAMLGTVTVSTPVVTPLAGDLFAITFRVAPREASPEARITIKTGPGLEMVYGDREQAVALVPGTTIERELRLRKTQDVDTSIVVTVTGASARRGGIWSYSGYANFRMPESQRQPAVTFRGADGALLVGDR